MIFVVVRNGASVTTKRYPQVVLEIDPWDDYGYKTSFHVRLILSASESRRLGVTKILRKGAENTSSELPKSFETLDPAEYGSLGQDMDYYRKLWELSVEVRSAFLKGICDIAVGPVKIDWIERASGFSSSLVRFSLAYQALNDARAIFGIAQADEGPREIQFRFSTKLDDADEEHSIDFDFDGAAALPRRTIVLIGRNGVGKTRLLRNLAAVVGGWGLDSVENDVRTVVPPWDIGKLRPKNTGVGTVVAISFSAFDEFQRPRLPGLGLSGDSNQDEYNEEGIARYISYKYVGNRSAKGDNIILSVAELGERFFWFVKIAKSNVRPFSSAASGSSAVSRVDLLRQSMRQVVGEDITNSLIDQPIADGGLEGWRRLSSGQRIVCLALAGLCAHVDERALVLFDEPETHLHPGLLSSLMAAIGKILERFNAVIVYATHHPFVLQQVESRSVRILKRIGNQPFVLQPALQTFGHDLGGLLQESLGLEEPESDWHDGIKLLLKERDVEEVEAYFDPRLVMEARVYLHSLKPKSVRSSGEKR